MKTAAGTSDDLTRRFSIGDCRLNPSDPTPPAAPGVPPAADTPPATIGGRQPFSSRIGKYRLLLSIALVVLVVDQLTKSWITSHLRFETYGENAGAIPVVRGFFYLAHVGNTGAAWSMFSGRSVVLAVLAAATLVAIGYWRRALGLQA